LEDSASSQLTDFKRGEERQLQRKTMAATWKKRESKHGTIKRTNGGAMIAWSSTWETNVCLARPRYPLSRLTSFQKLAGDLRLGKFNWSDTNLAAVGVGTLV